MRSMKLGILLAVFALSAIGAANASASTFTASATGTLTGSGGTQVFKTGAGEVVCKKVTASGTIVSTASVEQHATAIYSECSAFGFPVDNVEATYNFTSNGTVHVLNEPKITVTGSFFGECTITIEKQTLSGIVYDSTASDIDVTAADVTGIKYTVKNVSGSICLQADGLYTNGTYSGTTTVQRSGGGTISWDA